MKKFIFMLAFMVIGIIASAQVTWTQATLVVDGSRSGELWGTGTHDTILTTDITTQYIFIIRGAKPVDLTFQTLFTKVSGTVTASYVEFLGSNDGVTYVQVDSVKLGGDAGILKWKNIDDFNYSYLKVKGVGVGSAGKCKLGSYYSIRQE
jgi:hypothetical protein